MALTIYPATTDTAALAIAQAAHDVATQAVADAKAADDKAANARQMVLSRDTKLNTAAADAVTAISQYATLEQLATSYAQALPASVADRQLLHDSLNALAQQVNTIALTPGAPGVPGKDGKDGAPGVPGASVKGDKGDVGAQGVAGTANLRLSARPIVLLALGANASVVLPWTTAMPTSTYTVQFAHTSVATLGQVTYQITAQTTTSVTVKVTAAVALAAGTLLAVAY